jgi:hypothetical protein
MKNIIAQIDIFYLFYILLVSVNVRLFHTTEAYSILDLIRLYKITKVSKEEKLYVMKLISRSVQSWIDMSIKIQFNV